ncbi:hypothetical protein Goklo_026769 [Gossypium klotzschianum]|uniref:Uncharacterized protein n=1 Tax=Gossypium klotzschianum TaxID=34286 RepID=A0A7J8TVW5_9ROSI|nr:hypothetical protein [Gossypium klotzschianum]
MSMVVWKVVEILVEGLMLEGIMMVKLLLMNMLVILQHQMEWIMLLLQVVEKRGMGMRQSYETQMNMEAWLGSMKMKNMKMVRKRRAKDN